MCRTPFKLIILIALLSALGCKSDEEQPQASAPVVVEPDRYIYVASAGLSGTTGCYGGGVTTSGAGAPNSIARFDLSTGTYDRLVCDWSPYPGDHPVSLDTHWSDSNLLVVLVENATSGRRVDLCNISTGGISTYLTSAGLGGVLRKIRVTASGDLYISDSSSIEKFDANKNRITGTGTFPNNAFIQSPPGNCATAATNITALLVAPSTGRVLFGHQAASPNNHIGFVAATGYQGNAADCLPTTKIAAPTATAIVTHFLLHSSGKLLVSYGSTTAASNFVYAYDFDETNGASPMTGATQAYFNSTYVNGASAMAEDTQTGNVFVANALSTLNTIEKFSFNSTTKTLTRVGSSPFIGSQLFTRCVADMVIHY